MEPNEFGKEFQDIHKLNVGFEQEEFKTNLEECDFISLSIETSGLNIPNSKQQIDTQNYQSILKTQVEKQGILKVGFSLFKKHSSKDGRFFTSKTYQVSVCPFSKQSGITKYFINSKAILKNMNINDQDWNRSFNDGIQQVNNQTFAEISQKYELVFKFKTSKINQEIEPLNANDEIKYNEFMKLIKKLFNENKQGTYDHDVKLRDIPNISKKIQIHLFNKVKTLQWDRAQLEIQDEDDMFKINEKNLGFSMKLRIFETEKEFLSFIQLIKDKIERKYIGIVGFSIQFQQIIFSKKLLIGGGLLKDLVQVYHHFYEHIPDTLIEFKKKLEKLELNQFDIKYILNQKSVKNWVGVNDKNNQKEIINFMYTGGDIFKEPEVIKPSDLLFKKTLGLAYQDCWCIGFIFAKMQSMCKRFVEEKFSKIFRNIIQLDNNIQSVNLCSNNDFVSVGDKKNIYFIRKINSVKNETKINDLEYINTIYNNSDEYIVELKNNKEIKDFKLSSNQVLQSFLNLEVSLNLKTNI